jgi:hypothetical protein
MAPPPLLGHLNHDRACERDGGVVVWQPLPVAVEVFDLDSGGLDSGDNLRPGFGVKLPAWRDNVGHFVQIEIADRPAQQLPAPEQQTLSSWRMPALYAAMVASLRRTEQRHQRRR